MNKSMLKNKIDFVVLVRVENANPNGDPLNGNYPRTTYSQLGEISDVCIKRKIRNRLQDMGESIFVQSNDRCDDGFTSLSERASANIKDYCSEDEYQAMACKMWYDVRAFGNVFAYKGKKKGDGISVGVRGPVSIQQTRSINQVMINSMQITKSVNGETVPGRSSDTMGEKHLVEFGVYKINGSINVQLAEKTGFSYQDAEKLKEALKTLFLNDSSSARPDGSIEVIKLYWFEHNCKNGQYPPSMVHNSIKVILKEGIDFPKSLDDYIFGYQPLEDLYCEEINMLQ